MWLVWRLCLGILGDILGFRVASGWEEATCSEERLRASWFEVAELSPAVKGPLGEAWEDT